MERKICLSLLLAVLVGAAIVPAASARDLKRLIAPRSVCANQANRDTSAAVQEKAMRCMTDFARHQAGRARLADARTLDRSALNKSRDILRCDNFSHYACGRQFTYWMQRARYLSAPCYRVGENIAWGTGEYDSVRSIFSAWIHSPEHRANILGHYTQIGVGLRVGDLNGDQDVHVWTQHFGSHCGPAPKPATPHRIGLSPASAVTPVG